jgi:hypothetical protein
MSEDHDFGNSEVFDCVFETAESDGVRAISSDADDEKITEALIEENLWRDPTIRTAQQSRFGMLIFGELLALSRVVLRAAMALGKALVASGEVRPYGIRRSRFGFVHLGVLRLRLRKYGANDQRQSQFHLLWHELSLDKWERVGGRLTAIASSIKDVSEGKQRLWPISGGAATWAWFSWRRRGRGLRKSLLGAT